MEAYVRNALSCCCIVGDQTDAHQVTYASDPTLEERGNGSPLFLPPSAAGQLGRTAPGGLGGLGAPGGGSSGGYGDSARTPRPGGPHGSRSLSAGGGPSSARSSSSPAERQKEKERLQDMVKEFAKAVVQGQQCQWLSSAAGAPRPATYSFDKGLSTFSLRAEDSPSLTFEMAKILEVLKDVKDTPFSDLLQLKPPHVLAGDELARRFVCVLHEDISGPDSRNYLGLLMPNPYERERFYTCMKILRWALDSRRERS